MDKFSPGQNQLVIGRKNRFFLRITTAVGFLVLFIALMATFSSSTPIASAAGTLDVVYLGGAGANDSNDGETTATPVASFAQAKALLAYGGTIYVQAQISTVNGDVFDLANASDPDSPGTMMRTSGYDGIIFNIPANATVKFSNIIIDGNSDDTSPATGALINVAGIGATVNVHDGTTLQNNYRVATANGGGAIVNTFNNVKIDINGAIFQNNSITYVSSSQTTNGGAIYHGAASGNTGSSLTITNSIFHDNNSIGNGSGGAIYHNSTGGLTISGSSFYDNYSVANGGAIHRGGAASTTINSSDFYNNSSDYNGGAMNDITTGLLTITGSKFYNNEAKTIESGTAGSGGALYRSGTSGSLEITNSKFYLNKSVGAGGAINNTATGATTVTDSELYDNKATGTATAVSGGALYRSANGGNLTLDNSVFYRNTATAGAGAVYAGGTGSALTITNGCHFHHNESVGAGGAIQSAGTGSTLVENSEMNNNTSTGGGGGGFYRSGTATTTDLTITNVHIHHNEAVGVGGFMTFTAGGSLTINNSNIHHNTSDSNGGAISFTSGSSFTIDNSQFHYNTANNGGAIINSSASLFTMQNGTSMHHNEAIANGGAIYRSGTNANTTITNSDFYDNKTTGTNSGGAIYGSATGTARLDISNANIYNNSSANLGGGIYSATPVLEITDSKIYNNKTTGTGGGGGITTNAGNGITNLTRVSIYGNQSNSNGGGIYNNNSGCGSLLGKTGMTIEDSLIERNTTSSGGGGISVNGAGSCVTIRNTAIQDNRATGSGGGMSLSNANQTLLLEDSSILRNESSSSGGGILSSDGSGTTGGSILTVQGSKIQDNTATQQGGGFYVEGSTASSDAATLIIGEINGDPNDTIISGNVAERAGGGIYLGSATQTSRISAMTMNSGTISGNSTTASNSDVYGGGGIFVKCSTFIMHDGMIGGNTSARHGGAIYNYSAECSYGISGVAQILGGTIDSANTAGQKGDGIYHGHGSTSAHAASTATYIGSAEVSANIYLNTGTKNINDTVPAKIVNSLTGQILLYIPSPVAGLVVAEGSNVAGGAAYQLAQSDVGNIRIQTSDSNDWFTELTANNEGVLTLTPPTGFASEIYLDGVNGNDSNYGASPSDAVKTFATARQRLLRGGTIYIMDTVTVGNTQSWDLAPGAFDDATVTRYDGHHIEDSTAFSGLMIDLTSTGELTLTNITIDGGGAAMGTILNVNGNLNISGKVLIGINEFDGGVFLHDGQKLIFTSAPLVNSNYNIEGVEETPIHGVIVGARTGGQALDVVADYFNYLPGDAIVVRRGNDYILSGNVVNVTTEGLDNLRLGVPVSGAKVIFTLDSSTFSLSLNLNEFTISGLPSGLTAGYPVLIDSTRVEISITGTPIAINTNPTTLTVPVMISASGIVGAISDIAIVGMPQIGPILNLGADVTTPVIDTNSPPTGNSITIVATVISPNSGGQTVEYAISLANNADPATLVWQSSNIFEGLEFGTTYYAYARTAASGEYAAGAVQISAPITTLPDTSISLSTSGNISFSSLPNISSSSSTTISITTNNASGYYISMRADDLNSLTSNDNYLICTTDPDILTAFLPLSSSGALSDGTWGWGVNTSSPSTWNPILTTDFTIVPLVSHPTGPIQDGLDPDIHTLWFGARASSSQPSCTYSSTVVITAIAAD